MTESKTQDLRQSSRLLQVSSSSTPFKRVESGVGGWGGLPGHLQPSGSIGKRLDYKGVGSRPRISVWPRARLRRGRAHPGVRPGRGNSSSADSRSAQSGPAGLPHPVSRVALKAPSITEAAFTCLLGDVGGQGDEDPHPRPRPPLAPCILSEIFPGQSSQSLYPVLKVRVVDVTLFSSQLPFLVCRFSLLTRTGEPPGLQISYFLPPLTLSTDPGMKWLLTFTSGNHLLFLFLRKDWYLGNPTQLLWSSFSSPAPGRLPQLGFLALSVGRSTLPSHCTHLSRLWSPCGQKLPLTHLGFPLPPFSRSS